MPIIVFILAYLVSMIPFLKLNQGVRKTVSIESALQNSQVATSIIHLSFDHIPALEARVILFPVLYYVISVVYAAVFAFLYKLAKKRGWIGADETDYQVNGEKVEDDGKMAESGKYGEKKETVENGLEYKYGTDNPEFKHDSNYETLSI